MLTDHGIEENEGGTTPVDPPAPEDGRTATTVEEGPVGVRDAGPVDGSLRRPPDVVGRFLAAVRDEAVAARDAGVLTPGDLRAMYWIAEAVGEPGYFADLTAGPATPAWYPDPTGRHQRRYWNGERWTAHVADDDMTGLDHG